ncbi:oligosaccharide repeat unit polymerase family protein [Candidatus Mycolicibacterium alkanivorans]|uniref:Oligosaccharide repeat unit polymerase family protein n=1 Tax=Candidatus Mycolicibacterium alkanivorans TaxID=2954114 RepID=A0ABS9YQG8_9MYCO|nr:oligosaccharide repeat unit polymerase family protein [Candidatus Mycolicibacterium alkanivorans]MCI4673457.1 oligosaccharide repeat unit polymerase family protein [Candidatus Mycolicibacterium alkanivorans]
MSGPALFGIGYTFYFGLGSINFIPLRGHVGSNILWIAGVGLAAFGLGVWLRTLIGAGRASNATTGLPAAIQEVIAWRPTAVLLGAVGAFAGILIVIQLGGLPLLAGDQRLGSSGYLTTLMFGFIVALAITGGHALANRRWDLVVWCVLGSGLLILLGYRTFILMPLGALFFTARNLGLARLRMRWWVFGCLLMYGLSWLAFYRFGAGKEAMFRMLFRLGMPAEYVPFIPVWVTPREGTGVFAILVQKFPHTWNYQDGQLLMSAFATMLPGKQEGPRLKIAEYIEGRPGITITPSILGQPYVDWGIGGVLVLMFVVGFVLKSLWIWQASSLTWAPRVASAYVLTFLLLDIHSGILDVPLIASALFLLWWASRAETRARNSAKHNLVVIPERASQA